MKRFNKMVLPVLLATAWISISEFLRNSFLLHDFWMEHYKNLGIVFPEKPVNGALWGTWSLCFAISVYVLSQKFTLLQTTLLSWFIGFVCMWLAIGNMGVLPLGLLPFAIPMSLLEAFLASFIVRKFSET